MVFKAFVNHAPGLHPYDVLGSTVEALQRELRNYLGISIQVTRGLHIANRACDKVDANVQVTVVHVEYHVFIMESTERLQLEQKLNEFSTKTINASNSIGIELSEYDNIPDERDIKGCPLEFLATVLLENGFFSDIYMAKVSNVLLCRQIEIHDDEYNITADNSLHLPLYNITISNTQYDTTPDKKIRVCVETLENLGYFGGPDQITVEDEKLKHLWITGLVCSSISIVCLLSSLIIYCMIPTLRTTAGKLIMLLMISLVFALTFQALAYFFIPNEAGCTAVGIILHFSWLSVFTSMQACNFYMFKLFTSCQPRAPSSNVFFTKTITKSILYAFGLPLTIIILHVIVVSIATEGSSIGYGGSLCTFTYKLSYILATIVPVILISLSNIVFFIFTARAIHETPQPDRSQKDRNEIIIFLRLTSITGGCWVLQIIDAFLPLSSFSYVAVIVSSLQGLYIFLSFVANKRNIALLKEKSQGHLKSGYSSSKVSVSTKTASTKI